jgi:undecaprenyl diphosphate synthase
MKQSTSLHVALIMDGNGRWGTRRGLPRAAGHRAGAEAVRRIVAAAPGLGVTALTLYAFSSDNWSRPAAEVMTLMRLFARYLRTETAELAAQGVRLTIIGRRDRLPHSLVTTIAAAEAGTAGDFLLWECAYAELWFTDRMWPDFAGADLASAIQAFRARDRRFGGLPAREAV